MISSVMKILQYLGFTAPIFLREKIFYPIWLLMLYLSQHYLVLSISIISGIWFLILFLSIKRRKKRNNPLKAKRFYVVNFMFMLLLLFYIGFETYKYNPLNLTAISNESLNIVVMPIFASDPQSYFQNDNVSEYTQDILVSSLNVNIPMPPYGIPVSIIKYPSEFIPIFLYKHDNFYKYYENLIDYDFLIWGYRVNDNIEAIRLEYNYNNILGDSEDRKNLQDFLKRMSERISTLFNQLREVPLQARMDFLSSMISSIIDRSNEEVLLQRHEYDLAEKQIKSSLDRIDSAFKAIMDTLPKSKHKDLNDYYHLFKNEALSYKQEINKRNPNIQIPKLFKEILSNPYAPFNNEEQYFQWLLQMDLINTVGRYFPVLGWPHRDSPFENFMNHIWLSPGSRFGSKDFDKMFNQLRMKHGNKFIFDYYHSLELFLMHGDIIKLGDIIERQKKSNKYDDYLTVRQQELFKFMSDN